MNYKQNEIMLLNLQMLLDPMDELLWNYEACQPGEAPRFRSCQIYCGQPALSSHILYLLPDEWSGRFPIDDYAYITTGTCAGKAPHVREIDRPFPEVMNLVVDTFHRYRDFELQLNCIINNGGDLTALCRAASDFFQNPVYIHDDLFSVLAVSHKVEGMLSFEYNERSGKVNIPLWLINEFKFDRSYQQTLTTHEAAIWGNDQYPYNIRSLFVNLWDGGHYYGRVLVNEIRTPLQPGQFRAAEYFGRYALMLLRHLELSQTPHRNFEETLTSLISGKDIDTQDLRTMLNILEWNESDPYMCLLLQDQDSDIAIRSSGALNNFMSTIQGCISFYYQQQLCILINLAKSDLDPQSIRKQLAPHIRDSCMYVGISNPIQGITAIRTGFSQAAIALNYIKQEGSSNWIVPFSSCALSYIRECVCHEFSADMLVHPALRDLQEHDRTAGTQYYETLRAYLFCERNIPQTSQYLIIHRTTLTYRLGKILEMTNLNLEDPGLRLYLLLSFHILDHANGQDIC